MVETNQDKIFKESQKEAERKIHESLLYLPEKRKKKNQKKKWKYSIGVASNECNIKKA